MEIFNIIPSSLFTLLTSKNRELYAQGLLIVRKAFSHEVMVERSVLEDSLTNQLQNQLLDLGLGDDEDFSLEDLKDNASRTKSLVRKYLETGWIESEFARGSKLQELLTLPPYSIQLLDLIYNLVSEEVTEYDSYMYAMYSALNSADNEYQDYRYTAILTVFDKIQEFESTLKGLFTSLKKHYARLAKLRTVNQMLYEHFDSYQKEIIKQVYLPMKTKDSISRFKGPILEILSKWYRNQETMEQIVSQAVIHKQLKSKEEAYDDVIQKINFIIDKLGSLLILLESIDERNNAYVQTATDKMRFLLRNDKSISGKLNKIMEKLAVDRNNNDSADLIFIAESIDLNSATYFSDESLYERNNVERDYDSKPIKVEEGENKEVILNQVYDEFIDSVKNEYSDKGIMNFMHKTLDDLDEINSRDIPLSNVNDLVMFIYSFLKGFDRQTFYRIKMNDGNIKNNNFSIPDIDFIRKEQ